MKCFLYTALYENQEIFLRVNEYLFDNEVCHLCKALVQRIKFTEQYTTLHVLALPCSAAQGSQMNSTCRPTFLEFRELLRCALYNQCIHSIEFETLASSENDCSPNILIAIKQRRAASSSTEHSAARGQTNPTFHRAA